VTDPRTVDLAPLHAVRAACDVLAAAGWQVRDNTTSLITTRTGVADPRAVLETLRPLLPYRVNLQAQADHPSGRYELRLVNDAFEVVGSPDADPDGMFETPAEQLDARRARDLDADAALRLPLNWTVTGAFALHKAVSGAPDASVLVVLTADAVTRYVTSTALPDVGRLATAGVHRVLVALEPAPAVHLGLLTVTGLPDPGEPASLHLPDPAVLTGEGTEPQDPPPAGVLLSAQPPDPDGPWMEAVRHTRKLAAQLAWQALASDPGASPVLEFHGYKRVTVTLPPLGQWTDRQTDDTLRLRRWAFAESSPDRLLAVRQVVSLYDGDDALSNTRDIQASAGVVYMGLRTDAVAEVLKSNRDAYGQAQDTVRQAVKNAQDLTKAAAERLLATLGAVGAVVIARANTTLSEDTSRGLMLLIAVFLGLLAAASIAFDGPLLAQPIRSLGADLAHQSSLLTDDQRREVTRTPSLVATARRLTVLRFAVPATHLLLAAAIVLFGYPSRF
jgi:hypothetical protein